VDSFGMDEICYTVQTRKQYKVQIDKDGGRTCVADFYSSKEKMVKHLTDDTKLEDKELCYTQGDWDASCFTEIFRNFKFVPFTDDDWGNIPTDKRISPLRTLRFCYINDKGQYCGFSIAPYLNSNGESYQPPFINNNNKTDKYYLSHIQNVEKPLNQRTVTVLMSTDIIPDKSLDKPDKHINKDFGKSIDGQDIQRELVEILNSSSMSPSSSAAADTTTSLRDTPRGRSTRPSSSSAACKSASLKLYP
jgi:hypothetical protein